MNPLDAIKLAIARRALDGSRSALNEGEAADLPTMAAAYIINSGWVRSREDSVGSLGPGRLEDLLRTGQRPYWEPCVSDLWPSGLAHVCRRNAFLRGVSAQPVPNTSNRVRIDKNHP
jgi:hypothetical protein